MYYTKDRGFENHGFLAGGFENEGFEVESFFRPPSTTFEGRQDDGIKLLSTRQ